MRYLWLRSRNMEFFAPYGIRGYEHWKGQRQGRDVPHPCRHEGGQTQRSAPTAVGRNPRLRAPARFFDLPMGLC